MFARTKSLNIMKIAVTLGDPSGIGPELILKALPQFLRFHPSIYGNKKILARTAERLGLEENFHLIKDFVIDTVSDLDFQFGHPDQKTGRIALSALQAALNASPDILITAPIVKSVIKKFDRDFIGHTEYLARYFKTKDFAMVGIVDKIKIMFLTTHLPIADVPKAIDKNAIFMKLRLFAEGLKRYFSLDNPTIGVSALNPHGVEFSYGEEQQIEQGIRRAQKMGLNVFGPYPADSLFKRNFDGYLVMYHDQGFVYLKAKKGGVNWTLGLPIIRLSPLSGAALDIAGKNMADAKGMVDALRLGIKMFKKGVRYEKVS